MKDNIQVSVYCLAYNHEKYIRKTLEGFIMQKTNFNFEVIVHDDASTDKTPEIIKEYQIKYPNIIKPIIQKENQYSKGIKILETYILPKIKGKYIAACEGDDYWCDKNKLQKQFDAMEKNQEINFCVHKIQIIEENGEKTNSYYPNKEINVQYLSSKEFINIICEDFFQLSSYFWKTEVYKDYVYNAPKYKKLSDVGDMPLFLYLGSHSKQIIYFNEIMSCYRCSSVSSWTESLKNNKDKIYYHRNCMINMINKFNEETNYTYTDACENFKIREYIQCYMRTNDIKKIYKNKNYKKRFKEILPFKTRTIFILKAMLKKSLNLKNIN